MTTRYNDITCPKCEAVFSPHIMDDEDEVRLFTCGMCDAAFIVEKHVVIEYECNLKDAD